MRVKQPDLVMTHGGIRLRIRREASDEQHGIDLELRTKSWIYKLHFGNENGNLWKQNLTGASNSTLQTFSLPSKETGAETNLEILRIGPRLIGRVNETLYLASLPPNEIKADLRPSLYSAQSRDSIRDIEVINLDGIPEAEALRILGVDEKGNDLRALAAKQEQPKMEQAQEQTKAADALAAIPELKTLDDQLRQLTAQRVTAPFEKDLAALNANYLGGLDRAIAAEKTAGNLDGVITLEQEKKSIASGGGVPPEVDPAAPESLKKLRGIYREALAKLETARAENLKALTDPLGVRLKQLEIALTKQDRVAHAKTVREYRERLESPPAAPDTAVAAAAPGPGSSAAKGAPPTDNEQKSERVRPDPKLSRAAAEYALKAGATVGLGINGVEKGFHPGEPLPDGDFELWNFSWPERNGRPITDADVQAVIQARELRRFNFDGTRTEITSLAPFQNCPLLNHLAVPGYSAVTPEDLAAITSLRHLKILRLPSSSAPFANLEQLLNCAELEELGFGSRLLVEQGAVLNRFVKLKVLYLDGDQSDAILKQLGALDQLKGLQMPKATISGATLAALHPSLGKTLRELMVGKPEDDSSEAAVLAFKRFPDLESVFFRGEVTATALAEMNQGFKKLSLFQATITPAHLEAIARCRELSELTIGRGALTAADFATLRRLRSLKKLTIRDNGILIEPAAIPEFGKLETLTTLELPESQVTEAQVKELKQALPNCTITRVKAYP